MIRLDDSQIYQGPCFVPVVDSPGRVAVWRFGAKVVKMAEAKTLLGRYDTCRPLSEATASSFQGCNPGKLIVLARIRLAADGTIILLETSDA
jgi:hypothetical protein